MGQTDDDDVFNQEFKAPADELPADALDNPMHATLTPKLPDLELPSSHPKPDCSGCSRSQRDLNELRQKFQALRTLLISFFYPANALTESVESVTQRMIELLIADLTQDELNWIQEWPR